MTRSLSSQNHRLITGLSALFLVQQCHDTYVSAFTIPSRSLVQKTIKKDRTRTIPPGKETLISLRVSVVPGQNEEGGAASDELFQLGDTKDNEPLFQVRDMSSFQEYPEDEDDDDDMDYIDVDVDYDLEYDDDNLFSTNIDNMETSIYGRSMIDHNGGDEFDSFARDKDDILEEREDRLYVDGDGQANIREKCILIGVENLSAKRKERKSFQSSNPEEWEVYFDLDQSMDEMKELISTGGMELAGIITQRLNDINPKTYIGTGKVKEAQELLDEVGCCTVVFDGDLSPGQQKALENAFNKEIIQNDFLGSEEAVSHSNNVFGVFFLRHSVLYFKNASNKMSNFCCRL